MTTVISEKTMIPQTFALDFTVPPIVSDAIVLDAPPAFKLTPPDAGWIRLTLDGHTNGTPVSSTIRLSYVYPPLADLWLWSRALAANLAPARVRIDEEGIASELRAEPEAGDGLRISLLQEDTEGATHLDSLARAARRFSRALGHLLCPAFP